jgi:alpha/beta superfamily hydrolase
MKKGIRECCLFWGGVLSLVVLLDSFSFAQAQDTVVTLSRSRLWVACATTHDPITQSYILREAPDAIGTLLLFTGGDGKLGMNVDQKQFGINRSTNFLVRSRHLFASLGFHVAVIDAATDFISCPSGLGNLRLSTEHVSDIKTVIDDLRGRYPGLPVWVVGTSMGSVSAAQAAAALPHGSGGPDGLVLTSSVTNAGSDPDFKTVLSVNLEAITLPTFIISHKQDTCEATPPGDTKAIKNRLKSTHVIQTQAFSGGFPPLSVECEALSYHGYFGIEPTVVKGIVKLIQKQIEK